MRDWLKATPAPRGQQQARHLGSLQVVGNAVVGVRAGDKGNRAVESGLRPIRVSTSTPPTQHDAVVVGGGMAGLEAAVELRRLGLDIVVVDGATEGSPPTRWRSTRPPHYPPMATQHLRLGGRSLAWHGVVLRIEDWALREWPPALVAALDRDWYPSIEADLEAWMGCSLNRPRDLDDELGSRLRELTDVEWSLVPRAVRPAPGGWRAAVRLLVSTGLRDESRGLQSSSGDQDSRRGQDVRVPLETYAADHPAFKHHLDRGAVHHGCGLVGRRGPPLEGAVTVNTETAA